MNLSAPNPSFPVGEGFSAFRKMNTAAEEGRKKHKLFKDEEVILELVGEARK